MSFRFPVFFAALLLLSGCTVDRIRQDALDSLRLGQYEESLKTLDQALERYPESATLKSGRLGATAEINARLLATAAALRSSGEYKRAEEVLQRLLALDPRSERAKSLLLDLERDRRQIDDIANALELVKAKKTSEALMVVERSLKDNPRNPDLLTLQRRLEIELRNANFDSGALQLADTRPVSLDFRDVNLKMLLETLSRNTGIDFVIDKDVRPDLRATVFLRNARLEDALELITSTNQLNKKLLDPRTVLIYPNTPEKNREYQELLVRAFFLSNSEVKQAAAMLRSILKIRDPFVDEKLSLIVLREPPETIRLAERLIALHDVSEPEVLLEVEVLEIKTARLLDLGIKFPDSFSLTPLNPQGGQSGLTVRNAQNINSDRIALGISGVAVNLLRDIGDSNILANPRIRAKSREKARILVGDKVPVITSTSNSTGFVSESVSYLDVGLKVEVEPQVSLDDEVAIKVNLEVNSLAREIRTSTGGLAYQIGTRAASTTLRLRDGETQLLAGLISNEDRSNSSRLPGLGDLPVLGRIFGTTRDDHQRTEIVLSITPRIIRNVRRPDINMTEFWSGSETNLRLRPLALARETATAPASVTPQPGRAPAVGSGSGVPFAAALARPANPQAQPDTVAQGMVANQLQATLSIKAPTTVNLGDTFEALVSIAADRALRGLPVQLEFDAGTLELLDIVEGDFFAQGNATISVTKNIDGKGGRASAGLIRNTADGAKGEGTVLKLRFKAKGAGKAQFGVVSATPIVLDTPIQIKLPAKWLVTVN
jgi:general secretion pathway protein D